MSANQSANSTANPSGPRHADPEDLVLYALQFLTGDESAAIAGHLETCADCRHELARIQGDLVACAFTSEMHSPSALARQRLMKQVAREKKVVPIAPPSISAQPAVAASGRNDSIIPTPIAPRQAKRNVGMTLLGGAGWAIAAGLAVAAISLHRDRDSLRNTLASRSGEVARLTADAASAHQIMDALTDPQAMRVTLTRPKTAPTPAARATYNPAKGSLILLASNLEPLQMYKVYELWIIPTDGSSPIPSVTFRPDEKGNASVVMIDLPKGVPAKAFGITIEAEGGSQTPTLPIVMAGS